MYASLPVVVPALCKIKQITQPQLEITQQCIGPTLRHSSLRVEEFLGSVLRSCLVLHTHSIYHPHICLTLNTRSLCRGQSLEICSAKYKLFLTIHVHDASVPGPQLFDNESTLLSGSNRPSDAKPCTSPVCTVELCSYSPYSSVVVMLEGA